jgi:hypothetical protein
VKEKLGKDDDLVEWDVHEAGPPGKWEIRAIHYKRMGRPRSKLLTSLVDALFYVRDELSRLRGRTLASGTIPSGLHALEGNLDRLILPETGKLPLTSGTK